MFVVVQQLGETRPNVWHCRTWDEALAVISRGVYWSWIDTPDGRVYPADLARNPTE
jgi:hypothetical protein